MNKAPTATQFPHYLKPIWLAGEILVCLVFSVILNSLCSFRLADSFCIGFLSFFVLFCTELPYSLVRRKPQLFLSPMPWFLLASGVYFGFGPLIYFFGNEEAVMYSQAVWHVTITDLYRVTFVNLTGVAIVFGVWAWRARPMIHVKNKALSQDAMASAIIVFYLIGLPPRCVMILADCGLLDFTLPGFVGWIANCTSAGLVFLTATAIRHGGVWWLSFGILLVLDITSAALTFSKMSILLAVIPCVFGYMLYRPKVWALRLIPVFLALVYYASSSFVTCTRDRLQDNSSIWSRMKIARSYFEKNVEPKSSDNNEDWWIRLNYANAQVFAMQDYQTGTAGNSLMLALIAPVPRVLWPNKPKIESGREFYKKMTGFESASFGIGYFSEAYWNGGWIAVIICSAAIGWIFGTVTLALAAEQSVGNIWILPIALLWVRSGARVDGWMHTELVGPGVFTLVLVGLLWYWVGSPADRSIRMRMRRSRRIPKGGDIS